jgi:protein-tyrosine-phosphatase/DNA-binding transcriptional ArsR family regulator
MYPVEVRVELRDSSPPEFLQLVADPQRWGLLRALAGSDLRVNELTEKLGKPQNLVSYHLRELRAAGLVSSRRSSADGRDNYYRIDSARCARLFAAAGAALQPGLRLTVAPTEPHPRAVTNASRVLFLCTGNSARSQMAEALIEEMSGHVVRARSAGSHPKQLHANAVRVMAERGVDISGRSSKHLRRFTRSRFDWVITLCDRVREVCPEFPHHPIQSHWSMADPASEGDNDRATYPAFQRCAAELEVRIGLLVPQLTHPPARTENSR